MENILKTLIHQTAENTENQQQGFISREKLQEKKSILSDLIHRAEN